jgi:hypothetical protein
MKIRLRTQIPGMMLAVMLTLVVASGLVFGPKAQAGDGRGLEGTWLNAVKIVTCPPAPHAVIATFQSMTTYIRGGVMIEGGTPATPPPAVSRSAGHGIWERTGHHTFACSSAPTALTILAVSSESLKSLPIPALSKETILKPLI